MFKIDIKNTRTRCEICSKLTIKTPKLFFYSWLWTCICLLGSYLHFYCLDDFHYLDHFYCLHDLQKNWNFGVHSEISFGLSRISIFVHNASMTLAGRRLSLMTFWNYCSCIVICFSYNYLIISGKRSFINYQLVLIKGTLIQIWKSPYMFVFK